MVGVEFLVRMISILGGASLIWLSIDQFKAKHYFRFGLCVMFIIHEIFSLCMLMLGV